MNVALAGLAPREAAALGLYVSRAMRGWNCVQVQPNKGQALPAADLYVLDLAGSGLARWSEAAEAELRQMLAQRPAVLVAPAFDQSWSAMLPPGKPAPALALLNKPYGSEDMRAAMQQVARAVPADVGGAATSRLNPLRTAASAAKTPPPMPVRPSPVAAPAAYAQGANTTERPAVAGGVTVITTGLGAPLAVTGTPAPADEGGSLSMAAFHARVSRAAPDTVRVFVRRLADSLAQGQAVEVRFTVNNALILDPVERWVASNTPRLVVERVCRSDAMASALSWRVLDDEPGLVRAHRLGMAVQPLEPFLWEVAHAAFDAAA